MSIMILLGLAAHRLGPVPAQTPSLGRPLVLGLLSLGAAVTGAGTTLATGAPGHSQGSLLAFSALAFAGGRMLLEAMAPPEAPGASGDAELLSGAADAFLVGLSLPFLSVPLWWAVGLVGGTALLFSALGALLPQELVIRLRPWVTAAGGLMLTFAGMLLLLRSLVLLEIGL